MKMTNKIKRIVLALAGAGLATVPFYTLANPAGGLVVAGKATINQESATKLGITQTTNKAIIDWNKYSIGVNEQVQYYQPSASSVSLNRVVGQDPSQILGRLTANGQVFLVNPNGIYFGKNAQIDVAGLVASTHNIRNEDFLAGKYLFNIPGKPGAAVINEGSIRIADTGIAAFVAPSVANRGVIVAKLGKVALVAAKGFTLDFTGDELLTFMVSDEVAKTAFDVEGKQLTSFVENSGRIEAQGGYVLLTAKAAENAIHSVINQSGVIEAQTIGQHKGEILLLGGKNGTVEVSGLLDASAPNGGDGGFVETSGSDVRIADSTRVTTAAPFGKTGTWLIDPNDYTIAASGGNISGATLSSNLNSTSVEIQTATQGTPGGNGDIFVNDEVSWSSNSRLTLRAERNVSINRDINGALLTVHAPGELTIAGTGSVTMKQITYLTDSIILWGPSTATTYGISIDTVSNSRDVRIESSKSADALSIQPTEMASFLHASNGYGIHIGGQGSLTVAAPLHGSDLDAGYLNLGGSTITVDAAISLGTKQLFLDSGVGGTTLNAPISSDTYIGFFLSDNGTVSQTANGQVSANTVMAQGTGNVLLHGAHLNNKIQNVSADVTGTFWVMNDFTPLAVSSTPWNNGIHAYNIGLSTWSGLTLNAPLVATGAGDVSVGGLTFVDPLCSGPCIRPHVEMSVGQSFTNNVGASVFTLPDGKFWSLIANSPSTTHLNGLVPGAVSYYTDYIGGSILLNANRVFYGNHDEESDDDGPAVIPVATSTESISAEQRRLAEVLRLQRESGSAETGSDPDSSAILTGEGSVFPVTTAALPDNSDGRSTERFFFVKTTWAGSYGYLVDGYTVSRQDDGSMRMQFPLYNNRSIFVSVEVLDAYGNIVDFVLADRNSLETSPGDFYVRQILSLGDGESGFTDGAQSTKTDVNVTVPEGGSIRLGYGTPEAITANFVDSFIELASNLINIPTGSGGPYLIAKKTLISELVKNGAMSTFQDFATGKLSLDNFVNSLLDQLSVNAVMSNAFNAMFSASGGIVGDGRTALGRVVQKIGGASVTALLEGSGIIISSLNFLDAIRAAGADQSAYNGSISIASLGLQH